MDRTRNTRDPPESIAPATTAGGSGQDPRNSSAEIASHVKRQPKPSGAAVSVLQMAPNVNENGPVVHGECEGACPVPDEPLSSACRDDPRQASRRSPERQRGRRRTGAPVTSHLSTESCPCQQPRPIPRAVPPFGPSLPPSAPPPRAVSASKAHAATTDATGIVTDPRRGAAGRGAQAGAAVLLGEGARRPGVHRRQGVPRGRRHQGAHQVRARFSSRRS